jgi:hypothetical protein
MHSLRDAHEWLESEKRDADVAAVGNVLDFRLRATPAAYRIPLDLENIEELFSLAAAGGNNLTNDICRAIAATIEFAEWRKQAPRTRFTIQSRLKIPTLPEAVLDPKLRSGEGQGGINAEALTYNFVLAGLTGLLNEPRPRAMNTFISFNYDLVVEDALTALCVPFSYGFRPKTYSLHATAKRLALRHSAVVSLLKLHGSTNWAYPGKRLGKLTVYGSYKDVREEKLVPHLVPPTWRKTFDGAFSHVWEEALRKISSATRLVIIGFSMPPTDLHFKYLVAAGLQQNLSLREVVFVDANPAIVVERAERMFGELSRRPTVRIVHSDSMNFVSQGHFPSNMWSVGRSIDAEIQHISHY